MASVFQKVTHVNKFFPEIAEAETGATWVVQQRLAKYYTEATPLLSALYNGFTEEKFIKPMDRLNGLGMHHWYADSGGLQMVTAGREVTPELMKDIYRVQARAEFAMCFDVIPLRTVATKTSRNERVNTTNKVFDRHRLKESAIATGLNVKAQTTYFREHGHATKVILIVQGNNADDMVFFYETLMSQLTEADLLNVGGLAIADTCMGNEVMESVEMLIAANRIAAIAPDCVKGHLHMLGVGSLSRMRPALYLQKSGFIGSYQRLSYDSSTHTSAHMYGWMKLNGQVVRQGTSRTPDLEGHARNIYQTFKPILEPLYSEQQYLDQIFFAPDRTWHYSERRDAAIASGDRDRVVATCSLKWMYILYMIENFGMRLHDIYSDVPNKYNTFDTDDHEVLNKLRNVHDLDDMGHWLRAARSHERSKRINDKPHIALTLEPELVPENE